MLDRWTAAVFNVCDLPSQTREDDKGQLDGSEKDGVTFFRDPSGVNVTKAEKSRC